MAITPRHYFRYFHYFRHYFHYMPMIIFAFFNMIFSFITLLLMLMRPVPARRQRDATPTPDGAQRRGVIFPFFFCWRTSSDMPAQICVLF